MIGTQRAGPNDVGEIRRVLNSFLTFLEQDDGPSLIVAATNHPEVLDRALARRFDDVIPNSLPEPEMARGILESRLATFDLTSVAWNEVMAGAAGLAQAELVRAADEAAKGAVLTERDRIASDALVKALAERRAATV